MKSRILNSALCFANAVFCAYHAISGLRAGDDFISALFIPVGLFAIHQAFHYSHPNQP